MSNSQKTEEFFSKIFLRGGYDLTSNNKGYTLTASYNGACPWNTIERNQRNMVAEPICTCSNDKAHTVKAGYFKQGMANFITNGGHSATAVAEPIRVGALPRPNGELSDSQAMRVYSADGKSVNITSGGGGMGGKTGLYAIPIEFDGNVPVKAKSLADGKLYTVYEVKDGQITIKAKQYPIKLVDGFYIIRKLTVRECMRLQTVPEWYEFPVSNSQAYKMLGNGWTVQVIAHLLNAIRDDMNGIQKEKEQASLFD